MADPVNPDPSQTKLQAQYLKEINELLEKAKVETRELNQAETLRVSQLQAMVDLQKERLKDLTVEAEFSKKERDSAIERLENLKLQKASKEEIQEAEKEAFEANLKALKDEYELQKLIQGVESDRAKELRQLIKDRERANKDEDKQNKKIEEGKKRILAISDALTGGLVKQVASYFTMEGMLAHISQMFTSIMDANAEYAKVTGQVADRTATFGMGAAQFAVGFEKMNKAAMALYTTMDDFSNLNKQVQENLALSTAKLENVGVSAEVSAKNMNIFTKSMHMSANEAIKVNEELARMAIGAGIPPSKMAAGFAEAAPRMMAYGKQAVQVFADLQKQAKSLGMEISTLTSIVGDQMDTFEGAARAAGRFNAVMGGNYLNSMELLNATEAERVVILKRSFDQTGRNWDSLSKYEKKAIAASLGISDLNEATKLFSKSTAELEADQAKQAATQEELEKAQREAAKTMDQVKELFNQMMIAIKPLVETVKALVDAFTWANDASGGLVGGLLGLLAIIKIFPGVLSLFSGSLLSSVSSLFSFASAAPAAGAAATASAGTTATAISTIATAATEGAVGLLAFGAAVLLVGAGIALAAYGLSLLVASFAGLNTEQIIGASIAITLFGLAVAFIISTMAALAMSGVGEIGVALLLAFGAAALMVGLAVGIAAYGMSIFVDSLSVLAGEQGLSIANNLASITVAITGMMIGFAAFGGIGMLAMAGVAASVFLLAEALDEIPESKALSLQTVDNTLKTIKTVKEEDVKPTEKFITAAKEYYKAQGDAKDADKDALVAALKEVMGGMFGGAGGKGGTNIPIKLVIADGKDFAATMRILGREKYADTLGTRSF